MTRIQRLPDTVINQIAAGEVVERPASAVKELIENALDSGASEISVSIRAGGSAEIMVADNGSGIEKNDLELALARHATSKLENSDLSSIASLGFRGEALASIDSVSRLTPGQCESLRQAFVVGGMDSAEVGLRGAKESGTRVVIRELFYRTPARLKFLRSARAESLAVQFAIKRLALCYPSTSFFYQEEGRSVLNLRADLRLSPEENERKRISDILGAEFLASSETLDLRRETITIRGYAGLATFNRGTSQYQYVSVNGRPIQDRFLLGAIRAGYSDILARDRFPVIVLRIACKPETLDINVHPAKTEVRFRDPALVRSAVVSAIKTALSASPPGRMVEGTTRESLARFRPAPVSVSTARKWSAPKTPPIERDGFSVKMGSPLAHAHILDESEIHTACLRGRLGQGHNQNRRRNTKKHPFKSRTPYPKILPRDCRKHFQRGAQR